ncbi:chloramphenicol acetyltransferase [Deinococcus arcticus]|uniref:Chloramphenicol acetyltransferase n=1 Tax=Deinococcus arcticus TaxID=2136176 RepID=A0A2T3W456_9DEIO|nr:chloramphenicol acetyltransferase [Deinococcus arcticus]PTA66662.1 chloramphenicol acetyltransferase [Deinococcus arcticus]
MRTIDLTTWPRRAHFEFFRHHTQPHFSVTAPVDVTRFRAGVRERGLSYMAATAYVLGRAANELPPFRWRIRGEAVVEHGRVHPSVIDTEPGSELFHFCTLPYQPGAPAFLQGAAQALAARRAQPTLDEDPAQDDLLYLSSLPWVAFTGITHAMHLQPPDCIPRLTTGRFTEQGGRWQMPLSVQVHHALMDGRHVGAYFEAVQALLDDPGLLD